MGPRVVGVEAEPAPRTVGEVDRTGVVDAAALWRIRGYDSSKPILCVLVGLGPGIGVEPEFPVVILSIRG